MRSGFDKQLTELNREMISMGSLCENAIAMSAKALLDGDTALAKKVSELSAQIERKERDIESMCLKLLLQQQPVAKDLRIISSALKMVTDMERIGHQSSDIAEIISMANISAGGDTMYIHDMALSVIKMVTDSIDAFVKKDAATAKSVILYDDVVDDYFDKIKLALIELFSKPGTDGEQTLDLLMIAKYFERIGDHAVNIANWVLFSITGRHEETLACSDCGSIRGIFNDKKNISRHLSGRPCGISCLCHPDYGHPLRLFFPGAAEPAENRGRACGQGRGGKRSGLFRRP